MAGQVRSRDWEEVVLSQLLSLKEIAITERGRERKRKDNLTWEFST